MFINIDKVISRRREKNRSNTLSYQEEETRFDIKSVREIFVREGVEDKEDTKVLLELAQFSKTKNYHLLPELLRSIKASSPLFVSALIPSIRANQKILAGDKAFNPEGYSLALIRDNNIRDKRMYCDTDELSRDRDDDNCAEQENILAENHSLELEDVDTVPKDKSNENSDKEEENPNESTDNSESGKEDEASGNALEIALGERCSDTGGEDVEEGLSAAIISDRAEKSRLELDNLLERNSRKGFFSKNKKRNKNKDSNGNSNPDLSLGAIPKTGINRSFGESRHNIKTDKIKDKDIENITSEEEDPVDVTSLLMVVKDVKDTTKTIAQVHSPPKNKSKNIKKFKRQDGNKDHDNERDEKDKTKPILEQVMETTSLLCDENIIRDIVEKIIMEKLPQIVEESAKEVRTDIEFIYSDTVKSFVENASDDPSLVQAETYQSIFEMMSQVLVYHKVGFFQSSLDIHKELKISIEALEKKKESKKINELKSIISQNNEFFKNEMESLKMELKCMQEKFKELENIPKYVKSLKSSVTEENFNKHKSVASTKPKNIDMDIKKTEISPIENKIPIDQSELEEKLKSLKGKNTCIQKMIKEQSVTLAADISATLAEQYKVDKRIIYKILRKMMD